MARKLQVEIVGDASSLSRAFKSAGDAGGKFGGTLGKVAKTAGFAVGGAAIGGLALVLHQGIGEWQDSTTVATQTNAVLKSTGGVAGVTASQVDDLSTSLMNKSGTDDEAIKSGENMLLTFTNIRNEAGKGNDIFNQTSSTLLDMATAMNRGAAPSAEQLSKQAIQLGKALNDPIKGMGALRRVGVAFTEEQKAQIQALVDSGNVMGAQKIILHELQTEFGGTAEAAGKSLPGQLNILKETFNNVAGELVGKMIPALTQIVNWVNVHWSEIQTTIAAVFTAVGFAFTNILKPALDAIVTGVKFVIDWVRANWTQIHSVFATVFSAMQAVWNSVLRPVLEAMRGKFEEIVAWTRTHWPEISAVVRGVFEAVRTIVETTVSVVRAIWNRFGDELVTVTRQQFGYIRDTIKNVLEVIRGIVNVVVGLIHGDWGRAWDGIREITSGVTNQIKNIIGLFKDAVVLAMRLVGDLAGAAYRASLGKLVDFTKDILNQVIGGIVGLAKSVYGAAVGFGRGLGQGIADGVRAGLNAAVDLVNRFVGAWNALGIPGFHLHIGIPGPVPDIDFGWGGASLPDIPYIPHLDTGGMIAQTGLAVVHKGEAVIPAGMAGGNTYQLTIQAQTRPDFAERDIGVWFRRMELLAR